MIGLTLESTSLRRSARVLVTGVAQMLATMSGTPTARVSYTDRGPHWPPRWPSVRNAQHAVGRLKNVLLHPQVLRRQSFAAMPPLLLAVLGCLAAAAAPLASAVRDVIGPGDIIVSNYNGGVQLADSNITVYDSTGVYLYNIGNFNAPAGIAYYSYNNSECALASCGASRLPFGWFEAVNVPC